MSADFWAGYLSGAVGILVGNPLDIVKVRLQAGSSINSGARFQSATSLAAGTAAPVLGYGALNALLFVSYNRSEAALQKISATDHSLMATWLAGAVGGLATWVVSAPTELVKCRAQMSIPSESSWHIARRIWQTEGLRGFYFGGVVTALRDSIGYGFYFWSYELASNYWPSGTQNEVRSLRQEAPRILLCGGLAGVVTWASVFPLDTIKTRVQTQQNQANLVQSEASTLLRNSCGQTSRTPKRLGSIEVAQSLFRDGGIGIFFRGLTVCSIRAFIVNAVQWAVYEWVMMELSPGHRTKTSLTAENLLVNE